MGLFSSKKKTYVNTSVTRLIEDKDIPDSGKAALFDYLYADNKNNRNSSVDIGNSLADYIAINNANSIGSKLRQSRVWARNKYAYGVPEGKMLSSNQIDLNNLMDEYLTKKLGKDIRIGYALFKPLNAYHFTWSILVDLYGYNTITNELTKLSVIKGTPVYLHDIEINYCKDTSDSLIDPDTVVQHGVPATWGTTLSRSADTTRRQTPFVSNATALNDFALIQYEFLSGGVVAKDTLIIDFLEYEYSGIPPEDGLDDSSNDIKEPGAVTPDVEDIYLEHDYFMVEYYTKDAAGNETKSYFTYKYGSYEDSELEDIFVVNKEMGVYYPNMYFRMGGRNLTDEIFKDTDEYKSSKQLGAKLGLDWVSISDQLHESIGSIGDVKQMLLSYQLPVNTEDPLIISYLFTYFYTLYNQMPNALENTEYQSLRKEYANGYAKVGQAVLTEDSTYGMKVAFNSISYLDVVGSIGKIGAVKSEYTTEVVEGSKYKYRQPSSVTKHVFYKQLTDNLYRVINVYGLTTTQIVAGGKDTVSSEDSENLIIPLDDSIVQQFSIKDKQLLYSKSLVIILNTIKVVKTKWYQSGLFKAITFVIAVIVSVWTGGAGITLYTIAYAVASSVVIGLVLNVVIKFLVEDLGIDLGSMFAVVAVVAIVMGGAAAISKTNIMGMTSAQLMQAANATIKASSISNKLEMASMMKAHLEYYDVINEDNARIQSVADELNRESYLNPAYLLSDGIRGPDIRIGESMNTFLVRTLSVDVGLATLDIIPNMVNLTVALPTFEQTYANMLNKRNT